MKFFDFKTLKIIDLDKYVTLHIDFDLSKYLDMPLSESYKYLEEILKVNYRTNSVFIDIELLDCENYTEDDFIEVCDNLVGAILRRNSLIQDRSEEAKKKIMNILPRGKRKIPMSLCDCIKCSVIYLQKAAEKEYYNRNLNIKVSTEDSQYNYTFLNSGEK